MINKRNIFLVIISFMVLFLVLEAKFLVTAKVMGFINEQFGLYEIKVDDDLLYGDYVVRSKGLKFSFDEEDGLTVVQGTSDGAVDFLLNNNLMKLYDDYGIKTDSTYEIEGKFDPQGYSEKLPPEDRFVSLIKDLENQFDVMVTRSGCHVNAYWSIENRGPRFICNFNYTHRDQFSRQTELEQEVRSFVQKHTPENIEIGWSIDSTSFPSDIKGLEFKKK